MKNSELVKDPDKIYWDEENQVYMQYSPISDRFLPKKISVWDIEDDKYNPKNLPKYSAEVGKRPFYDLYKQKNKNNQYINLYPTNLKREDNLLSSMNNKYSAVPYNVKEDKETKQNSQKFVYSSNNNTVNGLENNKQKGIMKNDYSEDIDTLFIEQKYPELGRITNFNLSKSIPKEMWPHLGNATDYLTENKYGKNLLGILPDKGLHFNYDKNLQVPGRAKWPEKSITFSQIDPELSTQTEELFHQGQYNFYNRNGKRSKDIPAMNLEVEAKVGGDIIKHKNKYERATEYDKHIIYTDSIEPKYYEGFEDGIIVIAPKRGEKTQQVLIEGNLNNAIGAKIFMGRDLTDEYINNLYRRYYEMIESIDESGNFTKDNQNTYNEVGNSMPQEKNIHDSRAFNDSILPEVLLHILKK